MSANKVGMQACYGAVRDLSHLFNNERRKAQQRKNAKRGVTVDEKSLLRERFKPLNQRNRKKEKVEDDQELGSLHTTDEEKRRLRTSTLSDDSGGASARLSTSNADTSVEFD